MTGISRTKALDIIKGTGGKYFTSTFVKKDGTTRKITCQFHKDQTRAELGYVLVEDVMIRKKNPTKCIRSINMQTITHLKAGGIEYKIN